MEQGHGSPLRDAAAFDALPDDAKEEIRADVARLRSNLPPGELSEDEPVGIGVTSSGHLVIKTAHAAYQLMEDGSTVKALGCRGKVRLLTYCDGNLVADPAPQGLSGTGFQDDTA